MQIAEGLYGIDGTGFVNVYMLVRAGRVVVVDTGEGLTVMETPGHTDGSIALLYGGRFLFVGDALRGDNDGGAQPPSEAMTYDMARAWDSVRRLAQVPCDIMLPGHGRPIMPDAPGKVARLLQELHPER